tara:strand:+ start:299 stop:541 length:243 start_codon:yes stop_codon:yes gene_type:complete
MPAVLCGICPRCPVGFVGVPVVVAVGVPPVALGLCAFGVVLVGVVGVPYFPAFNDLLLVSAIIFHRQSPLLRALIKSVFL